MVTGQVARSKKAITIAKELILPSTIDIGSEIIEKNAASKNRYHCRTILLRDELLKRVMTSNVSCLKKSSPVLIILIFYTRGGKPFTLGWPYLKLCLIIWPQNIKYFNLEQSRFVYN